ncbi:hypothetical protein [Pseudomonas lundensis]|uniref:hypothetical protein n=1 Tax=Pseudomonas lundensis TaxID=86185 RepID=UPI000641E8A1|nr:hypothetical protein [Pseudomonas lundensis]NNA32837.1 hypothetical protein [Pseudomonas lundensis]NNA42325.1 hypothetical protein [Pseudomonas lundensis]
MEIQISGQYGDPQADDIFWPMQKKLNDYFKKYIVGEYFKSITKIAIVLRVSGKISDFKSQGAERLKYWKKDKVLSIDLVFSESQWLGVNLSVVRKITAEGIKECLSLMMERAVKLNEVVDKEALMEDIENALANFLE